MPQKKRERLTRGEQKLMAAVWTAGEARIQDLVEILTARGDQPAYTTVQSQLRTCQKKGWIKSEQRSRSTYYLATVEEPTGISEIFEEFAGWFLEGRPAANCEAISERLEVVTTGEADGKPARRKKLPKTGGPKDLRERMDEQESAVRSVRAAVTRLRVEVKGIRALVEKGGKATTGRRRKTG